MNYRNISPRFLASTSISLWKPHLHVSILVISYVYPIPSRHTIIPIIISLVSPTLLPRPLDTFSFVRPSTAFLIIGICRTFYNCVSPLALALISPPALYIPLVFHRSFPETLSLAVCTRRWWSKEEMRYFTVSFNRVPCELHHIHSFSPSDKTWCVNGGITVNEANERYYVDPGTQEESKLCLNAVEKGIYLLLVGARASGKTTRLHWLSQKLKADHWAL